jgi:hypothetical protein
MTHPVSTDKLGDLAVAIKALADWADPRLPGLGIEVQSLGNAATGPTGDFAVTLQTIVNAQCIVTASYHPSGNPDPSWVQLQVPVFGVLSGSPPNLLWIRCMGQNGAPIVNRHVSVCVYAWGTPV